MYFFTYPSLLLSLHSESNHAFPASYSCCPAYNTVGLSKWTVE